MDTLTYAQALNSPGVYEGVGYEDPGYHKFVVVAPGVTCFYNNRSKELEWDWDVTKTPVGETPLRRVGDITFNVTLGV